MMANCPFCNAELGPAEDPVGCLTCRGVGRVTNPDRIVGVLEEAKVPLAYWDVKRLLEASGRDVHQGSLLVWLSADSRTCWAGPGIYGLYRHGLLPAVRDLGTAAAVFLHAAEGALSKEQISFVLQYVGYRFQSTSMYLALRRVQDAGLVRRSWDRWMPAPRSPGPLLGLRRRADVDVVMQRTADQAAQALAALEHRLG